MLHEKEFCNFLKTYPIFALKIRKNGCTLKNDYNDFDKIWIRNSPIYRRISIEIYLKSLHSLIFQNRLINVFVLLFLPELRSAKKAILLYHEVSMIALSITVLGDTPSTLLREPTY